MNYKRWLECYLLYGHNAIVYPAYIRADANPVFCLNCGLLQPERPWISGLLPRLADKATRAIAARRR